MADNKVTIKINPIAADLSIRKTGQTTVYTTGDDGDLQLGGLLDFWTLNDKNGFGVTNDRFTMKDGTVLTSSNTYGDATIGTTGVICDWASRNRAMKTVLCYYVGVLTGAPATQQTMVTNGLIAPAGEPSDGWHLWNVNECISVMMWQGNGVSRIMLKYFNLWNSAGADWWTSTTAATTTTSAYSVNNNQEIVDLAKTGTRYGVQCRWFTETELGI